LDFTESFQKNTHQKVDGLDSGSDALKLKRLFCYVFMSEKSIAESALTA
jgi:hypothetical protein